MQTRKYILTIDGGGVRGMIPACALAELEQQAGKRAKDIFSFMAGTSTGSIIVAALALGIPAAEIVTLYRDRVADVFHGNWWWSLPWESMRRLSDALADVPLYPDGASVPWMKSRARLLRGVSHYLDVGARLPGYAYDSRRIYRFVGEAIQEQTGLDAESIHLDDLDVDVLITAQGLRDGHVWYFTKSKPGDYILPPGDKKRYSVDELRRFHYDKRYRTTGDLKLLDCVTGSSSAPTYFSPWTIDEHLWSDERLIGEVVDGGVTTANNPVYQTCVEAFEYMPEGAYPPAETIVVSLGTGRRAPGRPVEVGHGLVRWLEWSFDALLESPGRQQLELVQRHYKSTHLYRIDVPLLERIDLANPGAMAELEDYGRRLGEALRQPSHSWDSILRGEDNQWRFARQHELHDTLVHL